MPATVTVNGYEIVIDENGNVNEVEKLQPGDKASITTKNNYTDTNEDKATIPAEFTISKTDSTIDTGLVVIAPDGSEFVWVPVDSNLRAAGVEGKEMAVKTTGVDANNRENYQGVLYNFSGSGNLTTSTKKTSYGQGTTSYREPDIVKDFDNDTETYLSGIGLTQESFQKQMQEDYNEMIESVKKYEGFYVGRYETSISGETVASKNGVAPMSADTSSGNMWYGMYKKQRDYSRSNANLSTVKSSMIWGSQYDAMLNWALTGSDKRKVTATTNGNHNGTGVVNTGTTTTDKINNIYDLESNLYEWSLEAFSTSGRVYRGGIYNHGYSPSSRNSNGSINAYSCRPPVSALAVAFYFGCSTEYRKYYVNK